MLGSQDISNFFYQRYHFIDQRQCACTNSAGSEDNSWSEAWLINLYYVCKLFHRIKQGLPFYCWNVRCTILSFIWIRESSSNCVVIKCHIRAFVVSFMFSLFLSIGLNPQSLTRIQALALVDGGAVNRFQLCEPSDSLHKVMELLSDPGMWRYLVRP